MRDRFNQLELWGADTGGTCVHIDNQREDVDDTAHRTSFIVRDPADLDCDGLLKSDPAECSPSVFMDRRPPEIDEINCVTSSNGSGCKLGGPGCVDGDGPEANSCQPSRFCTTTEPCDRCTDWDCVRDLQQLGAGSINGLAIVCDIYAPFSAGLGTTADVCPSVGKFMLPSGGRTCGTLKGATRFHGFATTLDWNAQQTVDLASDGCLLELTPSGAILQTAATKRGALITIELDADKGLAIPALFRFNPIPVPDGELATACATSTQLKTQCRLTSNALPADVESCLSNPGP